MQFTIRAILLLTVLVAGVLQLRGRLVEQNAMAAEIDVLEQELAKLDVGKSSVIERHAACQAALSDSEHPSIPYQLYVQAMEERAGEAKL